MKPSPMKSEPIKTTEKVISLEVPWLVGAQTLFGICLVCYVTYKTFRRSR